MSIDIYRSNFINLMQYVYFLIVCVKKWPNILGENVYRNYWGLLLPYFHKASPFTIWRRERLHTLQSFSKAYNSR